MLEWQYNYIISPEVVVISCGAIVLILVLSTSAIALYKDDGFKRILGSVKNLLFSRFSKDVRKKKRKRQKGTITTSRATNHQEETTKSRSEKQVLWEEIFRVEQPILTSNNLPPCSKPVRQEGSCQKCKIYAAKKNCQLNSCGKCCRSNPKSVCRGHRTGYQAAVNEVEDALACQYVELDISYSNLKQAPPKVSTLGTHLVSLNLSNNRLSFILDDIGVLTGLKELFLQYNHISFLPESICHLTNLTELDVKNNVLTSLPSNIGCLQRLSVFCAMNNLISHLPTSIGGLVKLEELSLHSNVLQSLPEEICELQMLKLMYCGENKIQNLPSKFGKLVLLEELDLSSNQLTSLPESICLCQQLSRLWLTNNRLKVLPTQIGLLINLKELHVRRNFLQYFPKSITELSLYTFSAQHNPMLKENQVRRFNHTPHQDFPPLLELAARAVSQAGISYKKGEVPVNLEAMLSGGVFCSNCGRKVFVYFSSSITFKLVGVYFRLPLRQVDCSPHAKGCV